MKSEAHEDKQKQAALSLLRRLPPQDLEQNLENFIKVAPHLEQKLAPHVTPPLKIKHDPVTNQFFVASDYNCHGSSQRSPWSNRYFPPPEETPEDNLPYPSQRLRRLEEHFNDVFDAYKTSYYEGGVSSVYLWDLDEGFAGAFLIKKSLTQTRGVSKGEWDAVHVVEVKESPNANISEFKLTTSVLTQVGVAGDASTGETDFCAFVTRQVEDKRKKMGEEMHLMHIGRMIEDIETSICHGLDGFYMAKQREVLSSVRTLDAADAPYCLPALSHQTSAKK